MMPVRQGENVRDMAHQADWLFWEVNLGGGWWEACECKREL